MYNKEYEMDTKIENISAELKNLLVDNEIDSLSNEIINIINERPEESKEKIINAYNEIIEIIKKYDEGGILALSLVGALLDEM